jgi:hypothetical protein
MPLTSTTTLWEGKIMAQHGRKPLGLLGVLLLTSLLIAPEASPWGSAVHAYIDDHLGADRPVRNANEIYGGMAPDVFNYMFEHPDRLQFLYGQTHNNFLRLWDVAHRPFGRSVALGFVSHNDLWGADSTAHHQCARCTAPYGYVIAKAQEMVSLAPLSGLGIPDAVALEVHHNVVESAVDLLIRRQDPHLGQKITAGALLRSPEFPLILAEAYARDFSGQFGLTRAEAVTAIVGEETKFRRTMIQYGQVLMQNDETAMQLVAEQLADQATTYLGSFGVTLPLEPSEVVELAKQLLGVALWLCEPDYAQEIHATIHAVDHALQTHGIRY